MSEALTVVEGQCSFCMEMSRKARVARAARLDRERARRMETGDLEVELPEDPFDGMREK